MIAELEAPAQPMILSRDDWETYRQLYLADPWEFAVDICNLDLLVERFHKPVVYLMTGQVRLLIDVLRGHLRSVVISKIKLALKRRGLDWNNDEHFEAIEVFAHKLNIRIARKLGKTSCGEASVLWRITVDPNEAWMLISRDDPSAWAMCSFIGKIIQSARYRFFFPDRVPLDERIDLTRERILLAGRTKNLPQPSVTAKGHDSGLTSMHFTGGYKDDLTGRENKNTAGLKVVREFQANQAGLKMPEIGWRFMDITTGTRWARMDDSAALDNDPDCLTIYVAAEILYDDTGKEIPRTFENMMLPGEPTLPEWFDAEKIAAEKTDYLKHPQEGSIALLANLLLTVIEDAAKVFRLDILRERKFAWYEDKIEERLFVERLATITRSGKTIKKVRRFDVKRDLEVAIGIDPSISLTGDQWGITALGRDTYGIRYQLHTVAGRGEVALFETLLLVVQTWMPEHGLVAIGVEAASCQTLILSLVSKDPRFQELSDLFVPVPHKNIAKRIRAINLIAAPMESGELLLDPDDLAFERECDEWDPEANEPVDGRIDSMGIAATLFTTKASGVSNEEIAKQARRDADQYARSLDRDFGIPVEALNLEEDENILEDFWE